MIGSALLRGQRWRWNHPPITTRLSDELFALNHKELLIKYVRIWLIKRSVTHRPVAVLNRPPLSGRLPCLDYIVKKLQYLGQGDPQDSDRWVSDHMFCFIFMYTFILLTALLSSIRKLTSLNYLVCYSKRGRFSKYVSLNFFVRRVYWINQLFHFSS